MVFSYRYDLNMELIKQYRPDKLFKIRTVGLFGSQMNRKVGSSDFGPPLLLFRVWKKLLFEASAKKLLKICSSVKSVKGQTKNTEFQLNITSSPTEKTKQWELVQNTNG